MGGGKGKQHMGEERVRRGGERQQGSPPLCTHALKKNKNNTYIFRLPRSHTMVDASAIQAEFSKGAGPPSPSHVPVW